MKLFLNLFRKEFKNMYRELLIILVLQIGNIAYTMILSINKELTPDLSSFDEFIMRFFDFSFFFYPALLVYSLYLEEKTGTLYQMHALPVKRSLLRFKFIVILYTVVLIIFAISVINYLGFCLNIFHGNPEVARHVILRLLYTTFINLCIVCAAWGIMCLARKNRLLVGMNAGVAGFGLHIWLAEIARKPGIPHINYFVIPFRPYSIEFTIIMGGIFCLTGLFFYERYSEI